MYLGVYLLTYPIVQWVAGGILLMPKPAAAPPAAAPPTAEASTAPLLPCHAGAEHLLGGAGGSQGSLLRFTGKS